MISFYIAVMMIWTCTVKAQDDNKSLIHKIGFDIRPSYVAPTSKFLSKEFGSSSERSATQIYLPFTQIHSPPRICDNSDFVNRSKFKCFIITFLFHATK